VQVVLQRVRRRVERLRAAEEDVVEVLEAVHVTVEDHDLGAHADRDLRRVHADDAAADDQHLRAVHAGHAAEQHALAAALLLEAPRADLDRHLARDLAHGLEQRQAALHLDGLVRDARDLLVEQRLRELGLGGEVEVREEQLAFAHAIELGRQRLLHLHDHVGALPHVVGGLHDLGADLAVRVVGETGAVPGAFLHEHLVTRGHQRVRGGGDDANAVLLALDLGRAANDHGALLVWKKWRDPSWMDRARKRDRVARHRLRGVTQCATKHVAKSTPGVERR